MLFALATLGLALTEPPDPQPAKCFSNCKGLLPVSHPEETLAVWIFDAPDCPLNGAKRARTRSSHDACSWHYDGECSAGTGTDAPSTDPTCACDGTTPSCVQGTEKSMLIAPGAQVATYANCKILYHYDDPNKLHDYTNEGSAWKCVNDAKITSIEIIDLGHLVRPPLSRLCCSAPSALLPPLMTSCLLRSRRPSARSS